MKQELETKIIPLTKQDLKDIKISSIKKLKELEEEFKAGKIKEFHYFIFKEGLKGAIEGKITRSV